MARQGQLDVVLQRARSIYELLAVNTTKFAGVTVARHITWLYQKELPGDREKLVKIFTLLEEYSGISSIDVERHLKYIMSPNHHHPDDIITEKTLSIER